MDKKNIIIGVSGVALAVVVGLAVSSSAKAKCNKQVGILNQQIVSLQSQNSGSKSSGSGSGSGDILGSIMGVVGSFIK